MASALPLSRLVGLVAAIVAVGVVVSRSALETGTNPRVDPTNGLWAAIEAQPLFIVGAVAAVVGSARSRPVPSLVTMLPVDFDIALLVFYVALLGVIGVQYARGALPLERVVLLVSMCATWLAYSLLQVSQDGLVATGTMLNSVLDGFSVVLLLGGLYGLYWWWRNRESVGS
ncbi:hypothetical protein ACFQJC_01895 [Haloferax namakaokahaiae]|uniref:Uncharacterized protein n=1 Tax=Haloferax namakaokahaiae TaxID=1748331 RepID=A0ABD5ZB49_9EURY